ncbi:DUF4351 domain-containing protein [Cronbergia sp. UHCC 0137]|uniref:DUF4351 domain-containing protein n=1 Tax=Cronbergia sp. UHCC 0137 TaxID=3110239 RepID=UPI002B209D73|nr:DUF4351 domain-containing protein [Cronbergia sp. UHCC 0137]MEA5616485.1 DUF4351 domain-containing protein [Cronbergia sp. UHCC 0137]
MGEILTKLESQIKELSGEKLDALSEAILDFSQPNDLVTQRRRGAERKRDFL